MKTVFLFISNFVYSSDFLRTEYIQYLSRTYRVVVFMPSQAFCADNKPYYTSERVTYIPWNVQFPRFWNAFGKYLRYSLIRKYDFEPVVVRNKKKGLLGTRRRLLNAFSCLFPKSFWTPDLFTKAEVLLAPQSVLFRQKVAEFKPSLVLTATPGFSHLDAEAIILSKKLGIKTAAVNFSWDNLHNGGMHFRRTDYLVVWNRRIQRTAVEEYLYPENRVFVSGAMRFDAYGIQGKNEPSREEFLSLKGLDPAEKTILLTTVTKGNYPDEDILLGQLIKARDEGRLVGRPNIFVRMHPKEDFSKFERYRASGTDALAIEFPGKRLSQEMGTTIELHEEDIQNLKYTLKYADVVVNYASTITLESFVFDKPVINIDYPEKYHNAYSFRHYKPIVDAGAVVLATSFDNLLYEINACLKNPNIRRNERQHVFRDFILYADGQSYKRNVDLLSQMV